jgi:hypothetical protein
MNTKPQNLSYLWMVLKVELLKVELQVYLLDISQAIQGDGSGNASDQSPNALIGYMYGFNGKENYDEVEGQWNEQDYRMRIYDPRLGKF